MLKLLLYEAGTEMWPICNLILQLPIYALLPNARSCTNLERQRNNQRSEYETSTLAGVESSHLCC